MFTPANRTIRGWVIIYVKITQNIKINDRFGVNV